MEGLGVTIVFLENHNLFFNRYYNYTEGDTKEATNSSTQSHGPLSGQHISSFREACRRAVMAQPMRLMAAMYTCEIHATTEVFYYVLVIEF